MRDKKANLRLMIGIGTIFILLLPLLVFFLSGGLSLLPNEINSDRGLNNNIKFLEEESFVAEDKVEIVFQNSLKDELELSKENLKIVNDNNQICEILELSNMNTGIVDIGKINLKEDEFGTLELKCKNISDKRFEVEMYMGFKNILTNKNIQGNAYIDLMIDN